MVKQVEFEMEDKLADAGLDVRVSMPEEKVIVPLDSQKTFRIFENLFGNIAKYALPGTRVYVSGFTAKDEVTIILKNITAQELSVSGEELTERFVRGGCFPVTRKEADWDWQLQKLTESSRRKVPDRTGRRFIQGGVDLEGKTGE